MSLVAPLTIAAISHLNQPYDILDIGMEAHGNHALAERRGIVGAYPQSGEAFKTASEAYTDKLVQTVGFVCSASQIETAPAGQQEATLLVGPGLAARAVDEVLAAELRGRLRIAEAQYAKQAAADGRKVKRYWTTDVIKGGPTEALASSIGSRDIDNLPWQLTERAPRAAEFVDPAKRASLGAVCLTAIQGILPAQLDLERATYIAARSY